MAKDYKKGDDYLLYLNTGTFATPVWAQIKAMNNPTIDFAKADVAVEEQNEDTGHLAGSGDPVINFTLLMDKGDANVATLIAAIASGALTHIAVSDGPIATIGTDYWHMESKLSGERDASRGSPVSLSVTAMRHANSDNTLISATAA